MMEYELFKDLVVKKLNDYLPPILRSYDVRVDHVEKVNESKDAMVLYQSEASVPQMMPIVYIDELYELFKEEENLEDVMEFAASVYAEHTGAAQKLMDNIDFANMKDKVVPNLVSTKKNKKLLKNLVSNNFLDMSAIYKIVNKCPDGSFNAVSISEEILKSMNLTLSELHEIAMENIKNIFPPVVEFITTQKGGKSYDLVPKKIAMVNTDCFYFAAAYMLDSDFMDSIARKLNCRELYVVPLSMNELMVVEADKKVMDFLIESLFTYNTMDESGKDFLSNNIYEYFVKDKKLVEVAGYRKSKFPGLLN